MEEWKIDCIFAALLHLSNIFFVDIMSRLRGVLILAMSLVATEIVYANNFEEDFGGGRRIDLWSLGNMPNSRNMFSRIR